MPDRHPGVQELMRYLTPNPKLAEPQFQIAELFHEIAVELLNMLPRDGAELTTALRKLLEAKDCAVRHSLPA